MSCTPRWGDAKNLLLFFILCFASPTDKTADEAITGIRLEFVPAPLIAIILCAANYELLKQAVAKVLND
jgi:hypothetical protein